MAVVDASVLVGLFRKNDPFHARCLNWFENQITQQAKLFAPCIVLPEVAAAIARNDNNNAHAENAVAILLNSGIEIIEISKQLSIKAAEVATDHRLRGCDAVYAALAAELQIPLVTLDKEQLLRAAKIIQTQEP